MMLRDTAEVRSEADNLSMPYDLRAGHPSVHTTRLVCNTILIDDYSHALPKLIIRKTTPSTSPLPSVPISVLGNFVLNSWLRT